MASLFASWSVEEPYYRRISLGTSFLCALMSTFIAGTEMVRIASMIRESNLRGDLVVEMAYLVLWLAIGLRWGRGAWESTTQITRQVDSEVWPMNLRQ